MKGRMGVVRLSPNEEENLMREELQRRRKLRLQQVREQQSFLSRLVIRKVQQRRQQQLQTLAESLEEQWQQEHSLHLEALHSHYQQTLTAIGEAQRRAKENEPNEEALSHQRVQHQVQAQQRHREALRELHARQLEQEQQQHRHTESRRKALLEEKRRAERVSSLPLPPPNPVESVHLKTRRPLKTSVELLSSNTHCHMIETHTITAAEREEDAAPQPSALQAAEHEFRRLEDLHQQQEDQREEQENRARERGRRALQREHHTQERASLITQLERLQQVDLLRRRQTRPCAPPPQLYSTDVYCEQQRELENTFQEMYRQQRRLRGDLVPPLFPEPLPAPSTPVLDEDLDVTLDTEEEPKSPETPVSLVPDADPGRRALTKLMERIRRQREGQRGDPEPVQEESVRADNTSSSILENNSEEPSHAPEISDESVVAEAPLTPDPEEHQTSEMQTDTLSQACVLRQQQEQLVLLEELEQKRMELQQRLVLLQQQSQSLLQPCREPEEETSTRRLHQHQQRLLQQNRLHQQCVQEARRRLQEYQNTLHLRSVLMTSAAPPPAAEIKQHSEVPLEHHHHDNPQSQPPGPTEAALPLRDVPPAASVLDSGPNLPLLLTAPTDSVPHFHTAHSGPPLPPAASVHDSGPNLPLLLTAPPASVPHFHTAHSGPPLPPAASVLDSGPNLPLLLTAPPASVPHFHTAYSGPPLPPAASVHDSGPNLPLLLPAPPASAPDSHTAHSGPPLPPASVVLELLRRRLDLNKPRDGGEALTQVPDACSAPASNQEPLADPGVSEEAWTQQGVEAHSRTGGVCAPALVRPGRGRPPVSRAAQRSLFLQQMELHELSAILEVDTPVNASLDTECQAVMGLMDEGVSSVSLSIPGAAETVSGTESSLSSGRVSRCSWRDTLLHDSRKTPS
ncbi:hypothetical protein DNTS_016651 [Danionella cerebrum]|uniref:Uncharacterized protein n=1 Tax=Danionella cerebrum TaxID=2873325 RepID=A0A553Q0C1_9TELE|nr:hypothetical protein DNTS_016651 [Danionella translucida]